MLKKIIVLSFIILSSQKIFSQDQNAPTNLEVEIATLGGVQLSWDHPTAFTREIITQSNQSNLSPNFNYAIGSAYNVVKTDSFTFFLLFFYSNIF